MATNEVEDHELEGRRPCVASGYCCHSVPCVHGEVTSPTNRACRFIEPWPDAPVAINAPRFRCGKAAEIMRKPDAHVTPAFGAGCCSPLNGDRHEIHRQLLRTDEGREHLVQLRRDLRDRVKQERATGLFPARAHGTVGEW